MKNEFFPLEITYLSNGIPVVLQHHNGPAAATYWWNRVGSVDERRGEEGFAHFLEHMLFKDARAKETGKASTGKTAMAIEAFGGDVNAFTSFENTVYHVTCAEYHWEKIIDVFGAMAGVKKFLKTDFDREREVILEELKKNQDSPSRRMYEALFKEVFHGLPHARTVIGFEKTLRNAKLSQLEAFYKRNYIPQKMGLVLVGPIQSKGDARKKKLISMLERKFGSKTLQKGREDGARPNFKRPLNGGGPKFVVSEFDVKVPSMVVGFSVPGSHSADTPALDLLSGVLGMGESSRLYQKLFYQKQLVSDVSAGMYSLPDVGMVYFDYEMGDIRNAVLAWEETVEEIRRVREDQVEKSEIDRVRTNLESEKLYSTQTVDGMASRLGYLGFSLGDFKFDQSYMSQLRDLEPDDLLRAAQNHLSADNLRGVVLIPKGEKSKLNVEKLKAVSAKQLKGKGKTQQSEAPIASLPVVTERPSGIKVIHHYKPDSHVACIHASVMGGLRLEIADPIGKAEEDWGSSHLMASVWTKGTEKRSAEEISKFVESKAASLDGFSGRNSAGLELVCLSRDWDDLSELFSEVLVEPTFPESEVLLSKKVILEELASLSDHTAQLCSKTFLETLFETHPYGKITLGNEASLGKIGTEKLLSYHGLWVRPERLVLSVAGNVSPESLENWLSRLEDRYSRRMGDYITYHQKSVSSEPDLKAPRWVNKDLGRNQTHIIVGGLGTTMTSHDRYAARIFNTILGGQSGRLFLDLREKRSLAYSVAPLLFEGIEKGYIGNYIACSPEKQKEALEGIQRVLELLAKRGPSESEMKRAKEYSLGRYAMELQSDSSLASHWGLNLLYGKKPLSFQEYRRRIEGVKAREVQKVCKEYLLDKPMVTVVVG